MENAGRNAADLIKAWVSDRAVRLANRLDLSASEISIVCGKGNNGGDGFVIARHMVNRGFNVSVYLAAPGDTLTGDAAINYRIARALEIPMTEVLDEAACEAAAVKWRKSVAVIDAVLGTGFAGEVREPLAWVINQVNAARAADPAPVIVAIDVPSGMNANTGEVAAPAVRADYTVTFLARKTGFAAPAAREYLGQVVVADIGAPTDLILERLGFEAGRS
jgi:NAD(P)H-hydrate epimerase